MGSSFNPIDALKGATEFVGGVVSGGAEAFGDAVDVAKKAVSNVSISDLGHTVLDGVGMIPVVGETADLANAGWYAAEGDTLNATLSGAAAVPFLGVAATGAKWAKRGVGAVDVVAGGLKTADHLKDGVKLGEGAAGAGKAAPGTHAGPKGELDGSGGPKDPGGTGPGGPGGSAPETPINGLAFDKGLPKHLAGEKAFTPTAFNKTKLVGTHNQDNAIAAVQGKGFTPTVHPTETPGINQVQWKVPDPNNPGEFITRGKTAYDPKVFSDDRMLDMAQDAGAQAFAKDLKASPAGASDTRIYSITQDNVNFRAYVSHDAQGARYLTNVHPVDKPGGL